MHFDESDSQPLKIWIVKKLEDISDADSDVLADYVLALVKTDDPEVVAKANCVDQLKDFLGDSTEIFVNQTFQAIATRTYDPSARPTTANRPTAPVYAPPRRASFEPPKFPSESRKRSYHDWDMEGVEQQNGRIQSYESGDRPMKQARRGGRGGYEPRGARQSQQVARMYGGLPPPLQLPPLPTPPPGMPPLDPDDSMAQFMAMAQIMGFPLPPLPTAGPPPAINGYGQQQTGQRCKDYDTKGFCARGVSCPYEHGDNPYIVPQIDEYDPNNAAMFPAPARTGHFDTSPTSRGRGGMRGQGRAGWRGGSKRAEFSHIGRNHDRSITTIVVEQIPVERFDEQSIYEFFSNFGNIEKVELQAYKRLAIVKYDSNEAAQAAYDSPKSVFDNRFVKVYWYKPETLLRPMNGYHAPPAAAHEAMDVEMHQQEEPDEPDEPAFDPEEVAARQEAAQRKHEETKRQREEGIKQRQELDKKLRTMEQERKKLADLLAKKTGKSALDANGEEESEHKKGLREQLAKLEAEARGMGIDPDNMSVNGGSFESPHENGNGYSPYSYRSRGGYRGRTPRGRGYYQPSYRGGGYAGYTPRVKPTMSLDNRPKTVSVMFQDGGYEGHEEALRQYLMFNGLETATLSKHPDRSDSALVAFQQRYEGENLMAAAEGLGPLAASNLPAQLGKVELGWYTGDKPAGAPAMNGHGAFSSDADMKMETAAGADGDETQVTKPEAEAEAPADMDTYDDDMDRWG